MEETKRYKHFRYIKDTIKESQDYLLIGVDIAKEVQYASFMLSSGRVLNKRFKFENNKKGFESFLKLIQDYKSAVSPKEIVVGLETTGNYMIPLAHYLEEKGLFTVLVSSFVAKRNRDTLDLSWNKNDTKDAWNVTDCLKQGKIQYFPYQEGPYSDLKRLISLYTRLSK